MSTLTLISLFIIVIVVASIFNNISMNKNYDGKKIESWLVEGMVLSSLFIAIIVILSKIMSGRSDSEVMKFDDVDYGTMYLIVFCLSSFLSYIMMKIKKNVVPIVIVAYAVISVLAIIVFEADRSDYAIYKPDLFNLFLVNIISWVVVRYEVEDIYMIYRRK